MFAGVAPHAEEVAATLPGDDVVGDANVVMDRAFSLPASPESVMPWLLQLGKGRAGWYLPRRVERLLPRRALRRLEPRWQTVRVGDVVPDYGGRDATFTAALVEPDVLVWETWRGRVHGTWALVLHPEGSGTRMQARLRLGAVRRPWLARTLGEAFDAATIAGLAAGLRERVLT